MTDFPPESATELASAVVAALVDAGVTEVVLAPGSRNAPLAYAVWAAARVGQVRLHTRIDERTAGFLALGLSKVGSRAAVVCTSGTAVANLHPSVLEAVHAGVPIVVVSADRPARLRGTGANQTTDQVGIFGRLVGTHDVASAADLPPLADVDGPVHLNVQLDLPLVPSVLPDGGSSAQTARSRGPSGPEAADAAQTVRSRGSSGPEAAAAAQTARSRGSSGAGPVHHLSLGPRTVVVAGDDAGPPARLLAERAGWPLLAEPTSGARTGGHALRCYRLLLRGELGPRIERVVVFGRPTISRPVTELLHRTDVEVVVVPGPGVWPVRPPGAVVVDGPPEVDGVDDPAWLDEWRGADADAGRSLDRLLAGEGGLTPYDVAGAVFRTLPAGGLLVVGASSPVRDLDLMARPAPVGERRKVTANRGLSGIDGTLSTAIGAALGRPHSTRSIALVGDLTFLHDQTALLLGPEEERPDLTVVVVNDDGGAIFSVLEQGAPEHAEPFERLFGTPHGSDLGSLCAAFRVPHLRVTSRPELDQALAGPNSGIEVVEAVADRRARRDLDRRIRALVTDLPA
ncbi:MAG TPA: 2-succinyl-5-enolpyruvyl-6-hydroxy-3-cyclohexene-1-carboxylic-acid synthase [Nocardioides sp.]|nr:2-succinyl-5-enolpyruvyl-6-hydroxy-3-cyclohexene-1-carboxylic-acid synthase [Nocardioides sp.]